MTQSYASQPDPAIPAPRAVRWPQVWAFIALSFGLAWLIDLALYLQGGLKNPAATLLLQVQMLMPAFAALLLGVFFFKDSPLYYKTDRALSRWFVYFYFLMTAAYLAAAVAALMQPDLTVTLSGSLLIFSLLGLLLLLVLRWRGGAGSFTGGLAFGRFRLWMLYGLGMALFYGLQTLLNYVFKLGTLADITKMFPPGAAAAVPPAALLASTFLNAVIIGPFLGLIITFGEEYGWRGYLQAELVHLGRVRGVGLLGIIWGIWHWPIIWMGYNYPGQPILGPLLMTAYTVVLSYFLAYAVFKSKGVWTAAYLHALNNQAMSFYMLALVTPVSMVMSFGIGIPGLILCALVVLLLLRDPVWKETD
ncbi:MAG: CPBP family intramembrane metalloprotease [Chloroflexi bacterium]|nr:CPBP family intramembrane metalloprotease [Chloroflexota bacterium]